MAGVQGKVISLGYDEIIDSPVDNHECSFCLRIPQAQALLAMCEFLAWDTRWYSQTNLTVDQEKIQDFSDDIIRRLMSDCCGDNPLFRFDVDGTFQESFDGGDTWQDAPQQDPRNQIPVFPPPAGDDGAAKRCSAANSIVAFYQAKVADVQAGKDAEKDAAAMAAIILGFLLVLGVFTAPWLMPALGVAVGAIVSGLSAAAWAASFTEDDYGRLICAFYEHMGADGQFTHDGFQAALGQMETDIEDENANAFFVGVTKGLGQSGLNTLAGLGMDAGLDCVCGCVAGWTFVHNPGSSSTGSLVVDGDWLVLTTDDVNTDGKYYVEAIRSGNSDCCVCIEKSIDSGGAGYAAAVKLCGSDDWSFPLFAVGDGTDCWDFQLKFTEPTVIRVRPV